MDQTFNVDWRKVSEAVDSTLKTSTETINSLIAELKRVQAGNERLLKDNEILAKNAAEAFQEGLNESRELIVEEVIKEMYCFLIDRAGMDGLSVDELISLTVEFLKKKRGEMG